MFKDSFSICIISNGRVAAESGDVVKIPFDEKYSIRVKNKLIESVAVDIYVDGQLLNKCGPLFLAGNSHLDVDRWLNSDSSSNELIFSKLNDSRVSEPGEAENGLVECRFYKTDMAIQKEIIHVDHYYYYPYVPYWYRWPYVGRPYEPLSVWYNGNSEIPLGGSYTTGGSGFSIGVSQSCINLVNNDSFVSSIGGMNDGSKISGAINSVNCNGASIQGDMINSKDNSFDKHNGINLFRDPTILRLKLIGYELEKSNKCRKCGKIRKNGDVFCSRCGTKY